MNEGQNRLHPSSILIESVRAVGRILTTLVIVLVISVVTGGGNFAEVFIAMTGLIAVVPAVIQYLTLTYEISGGKLIIKSGLINKRTRTIPIDYIQNINFSRNVLHRFFKVVDVQIETASGMGAEATLSVLSDDDAQTLRTKLREKGGEVGAGPQEESKSADDPGELIYSASNSELFLAGASQNRAAAILGAVFGAFYFVGNIEDQVASQLEPYSNFANVWTVSAIFITGLFILLLIGWAFAIAGTFITYANFQLFRKDDRVRRKYGLLNQVENIVLIKRVQLVRHEQNPFMRWFKVCQFYVETAGSMGDQQQSQQQAQRPTGSALISPLLGVDRLPTFYELFLDDSRPASLDLESISRRSVQKVVQMSILPTLILAATAYAIWNLQVAIIAAVTLPLLVLLIGWWRYRVYGYRDLESMFVVRSGLYRRKLAVVPCHKVQSVSTSQTPIQRRLGLGTVHVTTAGVGFGSNTSLPDIPMSRAAELADKLWKRSTELSHLSPDGF